MRNPCFILAVGLSACAGPAESGEATTVLMDFGGGSGFYGAPFPSAHRLVDGVVDIADHPNPDEVAYVEQVMELVDGRLPGFSTTSAVYFSLDAPLAPVEGGYGHTDEDAVAFIIGVDPDSDDYGVRVPIELGFLEDGTDYGADNLLSLLPLQGRPLLPGTRYAAVVTRDLLDVESEHLGQPEPLVDLIAGAPAGLPSPALAAYRSALLELASLGIAPSSIAGLAAFTTQDPTDELRRLTSAAQALEPVALTGAPLLTDSFDDYCVYRSTTMMPVYQEGEPPFLTEGGTLAWDADGQPLLQAWEEANVDITVPRGAMPEAGYPMVVFSRTGGGGERPLVDRGRQDGSGALIEPGSGPAWTFAQAGWAGLSVDGPHGGLRNVSGSDEQFLMFNMLNPGAMRDNVRQSALELALVPALITSLELEVSDCEGAGQDGLAWFDSDGLTLMGHSMGATIAPLTLCMDTGYQAAILSGAGGSWTNNIIYKQKPLEVRPMAEAMIGYDDGELTEHDPFLNIFQWGGEVSDPPVHGAALQEAGVHVLMLQGIVDHYIMPPIANATSLSLGLDLGGEALDANHEDLQALTPLEDLLHWVGRSRVELPIAGNTDGSTRVVVQHAEDGLQDGHEVAFQTEPARLQYRHFLATLASGVPEVE